MKVSRPSQEGDARSKEARIEKALYKARREERITEAALRRKRAEIARLIALGQEEAADRILHEIDAVGVDQKDRPAPESKILPRVETSNPSDPRRIGSKKPEQRPAVVASKPRPMVERPEVKKSISAQRAERRRKETAWRRAWAWFSNRPPWVLSSAMHGAALVVCALLSFATFQEPPLFLSASIVDDSFEEALTEIELVDLVTEVDATEPTMEQSVELVTLVDLEVEAPQVEQSAIEPQALGDLPSDLMKPVGAPESGSGEGSMAEKESAPSPKQPPGKVRFFGADARADHVVFVVDNSGSMQRGRMETALTELNRSVNRLSHSQSFYVIFYSDQAYPMFYPNSEFEMLNATRENKKRLSKWLRSVEMCLGGRLLDAVELASTLEPEAVFLLSDGDIRSPRVMQSLTEPEAWDFTIHVLGMGARNQQHATNLASIAEANGGGYKFVDANPKALARSLAKPLPYHRQPGKTWGSAVQAWK